jgi:hypothetical protein
VPAISDVARRQRQAAAIAARRYLDGDISYDELRAHDYYDSGDDAIQNMFDLIAHEPSRRGFLAVSDGVYLAFREQVMEIVRRLETP